MLYIPCNYRPAGVKIIRRLLSQSNPVQSKVSRSQCLSLSLGNGELSREQLPMIIVNTLHSRCQNVRRASCKMANGTKPRMQDAESRKSNTRPANYVSLADSRQSDTQSLKVSEMQSGIIFSKCEVDSRARPLIIWLLTRHLMAVTDPAFQSGHCLFRFFFSAFGCELKLKLRSKSVFDLSA